MVSVLGFRGEYYLGLRTIRLDTVVGTVEEARGFDRRFRPASDRERERWRHYQNLGHFEGLTRCLGALSLDMN